MMAKLRSPKELGSDSSQNGQWKVGFTKVNNKNLDYKKPTTNKKPTCAQHVVPLWGSPMNHAEGFWDYLKNRIGMYNVRKF